MTNMINIYCDESCHLEHDNQPIMVLGGIWLPDSRKKSLSIGLRQLKKKHGLGWHQELNYYRLKPVGWITLAKRIKRFKALHRKISNVTDPS